MTIDVMLNGVGTPVERAAFECLFDNSVVRNYKDYTSARTTGTIALSDLITLARKAEIPYPLFFAPLDVVTAQVDLKTQKLLQGVRKKTFSLNSRASVDLADVELIVKDLVRKQELLKKYDPGMQKNRIVGLLARTRGSATRDAEALLSALDLTTTSIQGTKNKGQAVELLISHLESHQILVSRSVNGYMPQTLSKAKFSGLTVKDQKVPYIFLTGGSHGEDEEPEGRQVFTLTLLAVLVARRIFAPVTVDARRIKAAPRAEYLIVSEMLMPANQLGQRDLTSLDAIRAVSEDFKVTPSAIVVRASHLRLIERDVADQHLADLATAHARRPKSSARNPKPVNAVRKYNGREFSLRMFDALDDGRLTAREFCRVACSNKIKVSDIPEFRSALR